MPGARAVRKNLAIYLNLPNYHNHWKRLGFSDSDFAGGRVIDAPSATGSTQHRSEITFCG